MSFYIFWALVLFLFWITCGDEEYTAVLLVLRAVRVSAGPEWAGREGAEGPPVLHDAVVAAVLRLPSVQTECMNPCLMPHMKPDHGEVATNSCCCLVVLLVLFFLFLNKNLFLGDWTLWAKHFNLLISTKLSCSICLTNLSLCPFSLECTILLCTLVFYFLGKKNACSKVR